VPEVPEVPEVVVTTASARETAAFAAELARALTKNPLPLPSPPPSSSSPTAQALEDFFAGVSSRLPLVVTLSGDLGAGKTTFAKGFVAALAGGADVVVQSPTFALARTYPTTPPVHHLDLYRLHEQSDPRGALVDLGLLDLVFDGVTLVEWPPADRSLWPVPVVGVRFELLSPRRRRLTLRR